MTEEQRRSFDNLILLCPTHHTIIDKVPAKYTTDFLNQMKVNRQKKSENKQYVLRDNIAKILNISVNTDEYSVERIHNLLKLGKELQGNKTKNWHDYFNCAFKRLKLSSPISQVETELLSVVFDDILDLKRDNEGIFQDLLLIFLDRITSEIRVDYVRKIKTYIESAIQIVGIDIFFLSFISGASMNLACSLAPALLTGIISNLWLYWSATFVGTSITAFIIRKKFANN